MELTVTVQSKKGLASILKEIYSRKYHADLTLRCDDGSVNVHKFLIAAQSKYLKQILLDHTEDHAQINLPGVKTIHLKRALRMMYTGTLPVTKEELHTNYLVWHVKEILLNTIRIDANLNLGGLNLKPPPEMLEDPNGGREGGGDYSEDKGRANGLKETKAKGVDHLDSQHPEPQPSDFGETFSKVGLVNINNLLNDPDYFEGNNDRPAVQPPNLLQEVDHKAGNHTRGVGITDVPPLPTEDNNKLLKSSPETIQNEKDANGEGVGDSSEIHFSEDKGRANDKKETKAKGVDQMESQQPEPKPSDLGETFSKVRLVNINNLLDVPPLPTEDNDTLLKSNSESIRNKEALINESPSIPKEEATKSDPATNENPFECNPKAVACEYTSYSCDETADLGMEHNAEISSLAPLLPKDHLNRTRSESMPENENTLSESSQYDMNEPLSSSLAVTNSRGKKRPSSGGRGKRRQLKRMNLDKPSSANCGEVRAEPNEIAFGDCKINLGPRKTVYRGKIIDVDQLPVKAKTNVSQPRKYTHNYYTVTGVVRADTVVAVKEESSLHSCDQCSNVYVKYKSLMVHKSREHNSKLSAKCDQCGKMMSSKHALKKHKLKHLPEALWPFACPLCHKRFQARGDIPKHLMTKMHENDNIPKNGTKEWFELIYYDKKINYRILQEKVEKQQQKEREKMKLLEEMWGDSANASLEDYDSLVNATMSTPSKKPRKDLGPKIKSEM